MGDRNSEEKNSNNEEEKKVGLSDHGLTLEPLDVGTFGNSQMEQDEGMFKYSGRDKSDQKGDQEDSQTEHHDSNRIGVPSPAKDNGFLAHHGKESAQKESGLNPSSGFEFY